MGVVEIVADKVGKVLGEWFESIEARIAALEGKDAEDGCTYDHPFVDMDEVRAAIQQGTPESTGSGLCPKCGCNTSRTYDKKQFECIGCGHVWTCEAAGDGMSPLRPHHIEDTGDPIYKAEWGMTDAMLSAQPPEITPAMIEAGRIAYNRTGACSVGEMVTTIYRAMTAARESGE